MHMHMHMHNVVRLRNKDHNITSVIENRTFVAYITFIYFSHPILSLLIELF